MPRHSFTAPVLGELEIAVLEHVWKTGEVSAKAAHAAIGIARGVSLNTIQSTLERLYRKSVLGRTKSSHAFIYGSVENRVGNRHFPGVDFPYANAEAEDGDREDL